MPESMTTNNAGSGGSAIVQRFYEALGRGDGEAVSHLVDEHFAEEVELVFPPSLPYGGTHRGSGRLAKMFSRLASAGAGGPAELALIDMIDDGDKVVARLEFQWTAPGGEERLPHEALELWTFSERRVTEIRAFYWDTQACADQVAAVRS